MGCDRLLGDRYRHRLRARVGNHLNGRFCRCAPPHPPGGRTGMPAARRYPPIVSRRMCTAASMRRSDHPSRPSAMTCCLLFFAQDIAHVDGGYSPARINVLVRSPLAGFQVIIIGRFWVIPEALESLRVSVWFSER